MYSLELIEEIFLTLNISCLEDENESYDILKIIYNKEQVLMHNAQCYIISKKTFSACLLDFFNVKLKFLFFLTHIKLISN